jgi:ferrous iron transport protein A
LSQVQVGTCVRIKQLLAAPEQCQRLRELGIGEEQQVRLLLKKSTVVCEVCNVRLGLSTKLADSIWVEPLPPRRKAA